MPIVIWGYTHHISLLLLSFFIAHLRPLIEGNYIYRVITPLYGIKTARKNIYFYDDAELEEYVKKNGMPAHLDRYKGLGAHSDDEIEEFLVNADTRRLEPLKMEDADETLRLFNAMMGNNLELRKLLIKTGGDYE